ncbi:MAG: N-acetyltransferase [Bradyrhizobium sp.]|nr:MAG: N-acetyltransferase [Bradyrhizobium sp.]
MTPLVPERLKTARLHLRPLEEPDWRTLHEHYADPVCTRFTFGRTLSEGESWRALASLVGHWVLRGFGPYGVEERSSGALLGVVGLWHPNDWPGPEIKWLLLRRHWGRGFASEAALAVRRMSARTLPDMPLISLIHADNSLSIKTARAIGGAFERELAFRGGRWVVYRHLRDP